MNRIPILAAVLLLPLAPLPARAAGGWDTFLRPYIWNDLLVEGDTLWAATGEAGLLRFDAARGTFSSSTREPNGLAGNDLSSLARDRSGRLWIGTNGAGLSRLDPDGSWGLINRFDGLRSDTVTTLTAAGDTVWIGTTRGIAFWDGREIAGTLPDGFNPSQFRSDWMTGIVQDGDSLWISTLDGIYWSRISDRFDPWNLENQNIGLGTPFLALVRSGDSLFTLTQAGAVLNRAMAPGNWVSIGSGSASLRPGLRIGTVRRLIADRGTVVAMSDSGIWRWRGTHWDEVFTRFASSVNPRVLFSAAVDGSGGIWAANAGGLRHRPAAGPDGQFAPMGPPGNFVLNVTTEGPRLYMSTLDQGVGRFDERGWRNWLSSLAPGSFTPCTLCDSTFRDPLYSFALLADSKGRKWFGQWQVGIEVLEDDVVPPRVTHNTYVPALTLRTNAWASAEDSSGTGVGGGIWFGMDTPQLGVLDPLGLVYFSEDGRDSLNLRPDSVTAMRGNKIHGLAVDRGGRVWVGYTGQGIQILTNWKPPLGQPVSIVTVSGSENFDVQGIVAHGDSVWVMTTRDVRLYNRSNAAFRDSVPLPAVPAALAVRPLEVGPDGTVYVGTTAGLRVIRAGGVVLDYSTANSPLAGNEVQAICVDRSSGTVWIGTSSGLNRWDPGYVAPPPPPPAQLSFRLYPNPAPLSALGIGLRIQSNAASVRGTIHDIGGRLVHRFDASGARPVIWNGRDTDGQVVRPGLYFVRVEAGTQTGVARIALVR